LQILLVTQTEELCKELTACFALFLHGLQSTHHYLILLRSEAGQISGEYSRQ